MYNRSAKTRKKSFQTENTNNFVDDKNRKIYYESVVMNLEILILIGQVLPLPNANVEIQIAKKQATIVVRKVEEMTQNDVILVMSLF